MASSSVEERNGMAVQGIRNTKCRCGRRAHVKISEFDNNPNRLYAVCDNNKCRYFMWLTPLTAEQHPVVHEGIDSSEQSLPHLYVHGLLPE